MNKRKIILPGLIMILMLFLWIYTRSNAPYALSPEEPASLQHDIPKSYSNLDMDANGQLKLIIPETGNEYPALDVPEFRYSEFQIEPTGYDQGIKFDFRAPGFNGIIYYGLIDEGHVNYPQPVYFKRPALIKDGISIIPVKELEGKYDITGWGQSGYALLGYRIVDYDGGIIYDSRIRIKGTGPFEPDMTIIDGPYLNMLTSGSAVVSFTTNSRTRASIEINGQIFSNKRKISDHEILVTGLSPGTKYDYKVQAGDYTRSSWFKTAPKPGSRNPFTFAFTSDSRAGKGGGERNVYGTNAYIMKKMAALALFKEASFVQFTGDLINGYTTDKEYNLLQYQNFKRAIEPFAHRIPFYLGMGNHEALNYIFYNGDNYTAAIDKFPFDTESTEAVFAKIVTNPVSTLKSEDGSKYDPDKSSIDFPSYSESVFYYVYGNVAMVVLNSDYWYAPTPHMVKHTSGNVHGYVMDNQLEWMKQTIGDLEADDRIDHILVTIHTPAFPNGGHAKDDMWYNGNNKSRPYVAGKPVEKGIIERRDEMLDILINQSKKTIALLCGDEHNYNRLKITGDMPMYPPDYPNPKLEVSRPFWQITNGAAGAPYYAQEKLPWSNNVEIFSTQYALVLFHVDGMKIKIEVINPDTLELIEEVSLVEE
nr:metallophosphoesterase family protein [Bacteroidota bacterium]